MKWMTNGVMFRRGCYECLIARFDDTPAWYTTRAMQTQQSQKSNFKRLGELLGAAKCEVKLMYNEDDTWTEENILVFDFRSSGECKFYTLHEDGSMEPVSLKQ